MKTASTLAFVAAFAVACSSPPPPRASAGTRAREARVLILSTMLADAGVGEWGFSALVEVDGRKLLFDTGALPDTVLRNAKTLGVDLASIDEVILSHHHPDHTGGLVALRSSVAATRSGALAVSHVGAGMFARRRSAKGGDAEANPMLETRRLYEASGGRIVEHARAVELHPGVWLTGPIPRVHPEKHYGKGGLVERDGRFVEDDVPEDMSLVIDTDRGLIVVTGCGHAGIVNTLERARSIVPDAPIHAAIGGFHLFDADDATLAWTGERMRALGVENLVCAHCTGIEATHALRASAGLDRATCVVGAVGASFTLGKGIDARKLAR